MVRFVLLQLPIEEQVEWLDRFDSSVIFNEALLV